MRLGRVVLILLSIVIAATARAQTLSMVPERTVYAIGQEIVIHLVTDAPPGTANALYARLYFEPDRVTDATVERTPLTANNGTLPLRMGSHGCDSESCDVLWAIAGPVAVPIDSPTDDVWSTIRFTATAAGNARFEIHPFEAPLTPLYTGAGLLFFGQPAAGALTIQVVGPAPALRPLGIGALALLGAATGTLALRNRGRQGARSS